MLYPYYFMLTTTTGGKFSINEMTGYELSDLPSLHVHDVPDGSWTQDLVLSGYSKPSTAENYHRASPGVKRRGMSVYILHEEQNFPPNRENMSPISIAELHIHERLRSRPRELRAVPDQSGLASSMVISKISSAIFRTSSSLLSASAFLISSSVSACNPLLCCE